MKLVLKIPFLFFSNTDFQFDVEKFTLRSYTIAEALPTTGQVELIDKKEFAKTVLNKTSETFIIYISALKATEGLIHLT